MRGAGPGAGAALGVLALPDPRLLSQRAPFPAGLHRAVPRSPHTHTPTCGAGSLGKNENARELCKTTPACRAPGLSGDPGKAAARAEMRVLARARGPARSRAAEPRAGPGAQMRVSRAGSPDPGRARLSPPPARRPSGPGSPAGAAPPARGSGRRPGPPPPPA